MRPWTGCIYELLQIYVKISQLLEEDTGIIGSDLASFEACSQIRRHNVEELYQQAQAFMETRQLILVHVMGAPGQEASKTEPQWCDCDDIDNAWQLRSSMHRYRAETYKMSH